MLVSFLVAGFWYPYWRIADMDFWIVYNAFLLNVPLPQEYFDHPGYLSILFLSYWLRALHSRHLPSRVIHRAATGERHLRICPCMNEGHGLHDRIADALCTLLAQ